MHFRFPPEASSHLLKTLRTKAAKLGSAHRGGRWRVPEGVFLPQTNIEIVIANPGERRGSRDLDLAINDDGGDGIYAIIAHLRLNLGCWSIYIVDDLSTTSALAHFDDVANVPAQRTASREDLDDVALSHGGRMVED